MVAKISQEEREKQIKELCKGTIYSFVGWDGKYVGNKGKFICRCEEHGEWLPSVNNFIHGCKRCPKCAVQKVASITSQRQLVPKIEYENQINKTCEGSIYSFVAWDGEYVGMRSRFSYKCLKHGIKNSTVNNFITYGSRCKDCRNENMKSETSQVELKITEICKKNGQSFVRWSGDHLNSSSLVLVKCLKHGMYTRSVSDVVNRKLLCSKCYGRKDADERQREIVEKCVGTHYSFVGWLGQFKGTSTRFKYFCEHHGVQTAIFANFFYHDKRCSKCGDENNSVRFRSDIEKVRQKIAQKLKNTPYLFIGWMDTYKNRYSKIKLDCPEHGTWEVSLDNFTKENGTACPSCALTGYRSTKKGALYCLRSECGQFVKIGISNKPKQRFATLRRDTPFGFHVIEIFAHEDGRKAQEWEKIFHKSFESANLTGFNGCTEWLKWNPQIPLWFRFLT